MKLGILGADESSLAVARAAAASGRCEVTLVCATPAAPDESLAPLRALAPRARTAPWEELLDRRLIDAAVVADAPRREALTEALRRLAQAGVPTIVAHPATESMLVAFELDMIRGETGSTLLPWLPARWHPAVSELARLVPGEPETGLGVVEQLVFERHLADRSARNVRDAFARDVDLFRALCGEFGKLSAVGGPDASGACPNLSVQLTGQASLVARWSVSPADETLAAQLAAIGAAGRATLYIPHRGAWSLEIRSVGRTTRREFPAWDPAEELLDRLAKAIARQTVDIEWLDAARSLELTECIDRSLARGRTVELHYEQQSEHGTFKGLMTSLGCGLLLVGLFLLLLAALVRQQFVTKGVVFAILGLLGAFLLLQFLLLVIRKEPPPGDPPL